jgi:hypothetical protein
MNTSASVAEVLGAGVEIQPEEAVAIVQQLIVALRDLTPPHTAKPPYGPPTADTVHLAADGAVLCRACEATPAVSEIARLLETMLPLSTRTPGGLRYAMARALLDVDVPPFDSLDDFAETLARYERGPRSQVVAGVMQRFGHKRSVVVRGAAERRRDPRSTELRRALREADRRLYLQKAATEAVAATVANRPHHPRATRAAAGCVAAGLLLIVTGEFIDGWHSAPPTIVVTTPAARGTAGLTDAPIVRDVQDSPTMAPEPANRDVRTQSPRTSPRTENVRETPKRARGPRRSSPVAHAQSPRQASSKPSSPPRVLEKLRLNWLRNVLTSL